MVNKVDDIVRVLSDEGQSSEEEGHPEDRGVVPDGVCWRCVRRRVDAGRDLCLACRAFLLGDTDLDPIESVAFGDALVHHDDEVLVGQRSYVSRLFDETVHEIVPVPVVEITVVLRGGVSDGVTMAVRSTPDGGPPAELFMPVGMDHAVIRTERYVWDPTSGPGVWCYDAEVTRREDGGTAGQTEF